MPQVTIATFNIRNSRGLDGRNIWWLRRGNTLRVIQSLNADVICLQEVRFGQLHWLRRHLDDYELAGVGRDDGVSKGEHLVIAVRKANLSAGPVRTRWFSSTPDRPSRDPQSAFNRMAISIELRADGKTFTVVNTHLEERHESVRREAIRMLADWFPGDAVLVGDFNTTVDDLALEPLWRAGYQDVLGITPPSGPGLATHHSFSGTRDGTRIDHILVPGSTNVVSAAIVHDRPPGPLPSDHWPVVATVII